MPTQNFFSIELNLCYTGTRFITLAVLPFERGNELRGPTARLSACAMQLRRNVTEVANCWLQFVRFDRLEN